MAKDTLTLEATGRRKTSVARVRMTEGSGTITVNGLESDKYFNTALQQEVLKKPFQALGIEGKHDIIATVKGGGKSGQCGAVVHAVSRALAASDEEMRELLKKAGFLTRDARMKERKKPGQPGARKRFQFSKR
ncbi:30S ribosomal protein S9 [Pontiella sulfatireligans]|uniref:Small ribosomal subunit protein uS9 n=1 Tax=Pontiella sulfatireligans TaxID=2750658 RepID=A0A6C2UIJ4_9BACT|nr:30S ribosomal protein S9 [Pontiella sulfatireligans]VGO20042.1 30S ribosomal protein S9 [Pontiella sulfatireligans]